MHWVVFSYSLPAKSRSSPRVAVWRRLGRLGAVSTTSGVYVLPARDECVEALQWLAQETRQAKGEALVMRVEQFEGLTDTQLIEQFNQSRQAEYRDVDAQAAELEKASKSKRRVEEHAELQEWLGKLRKRYLEIARVDYFDCPAAGTVAARLDRIEQALAPVATVPIPKSAVSIAEFKNRRWVTRPRPHVDRLACIWLIRHFINPRAKIRYSAHPESHEVSFDMPKAHFGHLGNHCTFETMLQSFGLDEPALRTMAEIVHEIDLRDGQYSQPQVEGIDAVLSGWLKANLSDAELESHGVALFEGLYQTLASTTPVKARRQNRQKRQR